MGKFCLVEIQWIDWISVATTESESSLFFREIFLRLMGSILIAKREF